MRALLAAVGTQGDVQPVLALALELRKLGHAVRLCISPNFVDRAKSLGLEAVPMGVEMRMPAQGSGGAQTLTPEDLRRLRESGISFKPSRTRATSSSELCEAFTASPFLSQAVREIAPTVDGCRLLARVLTAAAPPASRR